MDNRPCLHLTAYPYVKPVNRVIAGRTGLKLEERGQANHAIGS